MRVPLTIAVLLLVVACESSSPYARRREEYLEAHPDTKPAVRAAILEGEILVGMTYPEVVASIGRFDSAGPDMSRHGDYHVRLYDERALAFFGAELEDAELIFVAKWMDDPMFRRIQDRIRAHDARQ